MATVRYSTRAEADVLSIGSYTLQQWDVNQAARYLAQLEECCNRLAASPATVARATTSGRVCAAWSKASM